MSEMTGLQRLRDFAEKGAAMLTYYQVEDLRVIADQIEAEQEERITRRLEDREAAEWVRDHGGLDAVRTSCGHADNRRVELCSALGIDLDTGWSDAMERMRLRIMPDGMEWPRFEDGEPVRIGDKFECWCGEGHVVGSVSFWGSCAVLNISHDHTFVVGHGPEAVHDEHAKRPAPKVLDADGVEIRVGDTVHSTRDTESGTVVYAYPPGDDGQPSVKVGALWHHASDLTHRAPVLAADAKPLREGETVYRLDGAGTVEIDTVFDAACIVCLKPDTGDELGHFKACELTHERPDSWERLEEDAAKNCWEYWGCKPFLCPGSCPNELDGKHPYERFGVDDCCDAAVKDIVRRARALAGDA